jgi:hypothetical protein
VTSVPRSEAIRGAAAEAFLAFRRELVAEGRAVVAVVVLDGEARMRLIMGCSCEPDVATMRAGDGLVDAIALRHLDQNCARASSALW